MSPFLTPQPPTTLHLAVIGAGAAGLAAARELLRSGHNPTIFERSDAVGGVWNYTPNQESDPLSLDPNRTIVHSSLYRSLRTNLPREVMGFLDYPFSGNRVDAGDRRRFPGHREVLRYLQSFSEEFELSKLMKFEREVVRVERIEDGKWVVKSRIAGGGGEGGEIEREVFDGVVVCNGHYCEPRTAEINGINVWPGKQIHSHNYRVPEPFQDQVVVIIGSAASAEDISRDISICAKEVHVAKRSAPDGSPIQLCGYDNIWLHGMIAETFSDGTVLFQDGSSIHVDVIMHCTGYKYHFPFLETNCIVTVDDNCVGPLYKHIFPPSLAPNLSFIGLPWKVVPFPLVELQSKWVAGVLSGRIALPTPDEMMEEVKSYYLKLEAAGVPKRYTHNFDDCQFDYDDWLASECGCSPVEEWRKKMYYINRKNKAARPERYRDEWDDDDLVAQAEEHFKKFM